MSSALVLSPHIRSLIRMALAEDDAAHDITTRLTVPEHLSGSAVIIARGAMVLCGGALINAIAEEAKATLEVSAVIADGTAVQADQVVARLTGRVAELLALERTMLNFLQKLSGIATFTRQVVANVRNIKVLDTRKTTPGWRELEKYAVRCGGGMNHRGSLSEMALVKNNHIDANDGDVVQTLERLYRDKSPTLAVEVEVRSLDELRAALPYHPDTVMFDNMTDQQIAEGMAMIRCADRRPKVEVSGGITASRLAKLELLGVDCVSMGALTTQAPWCDLSMRIRHE